ncbi:MAG: hypothetical protein HYS43_01165 [Candidatus Liptonbacteria bacterium]|nr:hypothetical protein [Candidatus Liptonbacteria bacterium]
MNLLKRKDLVIAFAAAGAFLLAGAALVYVSLVPLAGPTRAMIILHFSGYRGIDFVGSPTALFGILSVAGVLLLINGIIANTLAPRQPIFARIVAGGTFIPCAMVFLYILGIVSVN